MRRMSDLTHGTTIDWLGRLVAHLKIGIDSDLLVRKLIQILASAVLPTNGLGSFICTTMLSLLIHNRQ